MWAMNFKLPLTSLYIVYFSFVVNEVEKVTGVQPGHAILEK